MILIIGRDGNASKKSRIANTNFTNQNLNHHCTNKTKSNFITNTSIPITEHHLTDCMTKSFPILAGFNHFFCEFSRNPFNSAPTFPNQAQWNASSDSDFDLSSSSMTSGVNQTPKVNNHQKTAERMAEDESELFTTSDCDKNSN